ncbi:hypothetical protein G7K_2770-t1 [Saitoella complicata NRRL Y-17804]|uniref:Uncharacterized protein n=1 Tax=Saitoella complicata (strain BCRC 22490 / CBS 7301 / JCM 7358 / NBRC 10748 / NRRL Y-17804) TaxID=698492 RepID=A0A0E9NFI1_SAICN|nr:hypothetical protein G7K_2770-t1 [Saitoella complicata NRRL Y-17804]
MSFLGTPSNMAFSRFSLQHPNSSLLSDPFRALKRVGLALNKHYGNVADRSDNAVRGAGVSFSFGVAVGSLLRIGECPALLPHLSVFRPSAPDRAGSLMTPHPTGTAGPVTSAHTTGSISAKARASLNAKNADKRRSKNLIMDLSLITITIKPSVAHLI